MLRVPDVIFGVRNLLLVSLCFLFVSAVLATLFGLAKLSYPANAVTNIALWVAVLIGSYVTTRSLPTFGQVWLFGGVLGGVFGFVVFAAMVVFYSIAGALSGGSVLGLLPVVIFYAVLGLIGATLASMAGSPRRA